MVNFLKNLKISYRTYQYYKTEVDKMPLQVAQYVQYLRVTGPRTHSWRALAEDVCNAFQNYADPWLSGNQMYGEELCKIAAIKLGIIKMGWFRWSYSKEWDKW